MPSESQGNGTAPKTPVQTAEAAAADLEKCRKAIALELETMKAAARERGEEFDFNNLYTRLPDETGVSGEWKMINRYNGLDEFMETMVDDPSKRTLGMSTTHREFYSQLDKILERLSSQNKIDIVEIKQLVQTSNRERRTPEGLEARRRLQIIIKPIYDELRLLGFSHSEVCGKE